MRRLLLVSLLLLTGCAGIEGPRMRAANPQPYPALQDQQQWIRANTAFPDPSTPYAGPRNYASIPAEQWGQRNP